MPPQNTQPTSDSKNIVVWSVIIALLLVAGIAFWFVRKNDAGTDDSHTATTTEDVNAANISVTSPRPNERIGLPVVITGRARVFENTVNVRLLDANGKEIAKGFATADALDIGQFGPFRVELLYSAEADGKGTLEVFADSAKDGSEIDKVIIPIFYTKTPDFIKG